MSKNEHFALKSASSDFTLRQKNVFDQLLALETDRKNLQPGNEEQMEIDREDHRNSSSSNPRMQRAITKRLRGKESIFKKPQNPVPKNYINRIPDFKKHPHKWTRYTLDDVKDEDMSDKSNTKAALSFLEELEVRKLSDSSLEDANVNVSQKILFKKHRPLEVHRKLEEDPESLKASFISSKVVMPEYVVGKKIIKEKKKQDVAKGKELKLDHLYDDD